MYRWFAWNILFRAHERAKGHTSYRILRDMQAADQLSSTELKELQAKRLRDFLEYTYTHVPFVRKQMQKAGVTLAQMRDAQDLIRLPVTTKADIRSHREDLRSDSGTKLVPFTTGGSTGEPLIFNLSKRRISSRVACRQRVSKWWGVSVGDPEVALWGAPAEVTRQDWLRGLRDTFLRTRLLSAFEMNEATMARYLEIIENGNFRQIFGYPSAIYLLCLQARKQGCNLRRPGVKVVFVTGEVLYPHQREIISKTFGCPVANGYGGRDSGFISHECPQGGMHVLSDAVVVELVDANGLPVGPGESGEIVVTDLYSHEAPFLRYATGDLAIWSTRRCSCGRALPLLERIEGRSNDCVVASDGRIINSLALVYSVREVEGIEQFRVCQNTVDQFSVQIVRNERFQKEDEERIRRAWIQLLRSPLYVTFEYVTQLKPEKSGKFRHVVSRLQAGQNFGPSLPDEPAAGLYSQTRSI